VSSERANSPSLTRTLRTTGAIAGHLDDGTPYFSPIGEVVADHSQVICHLCGRAFRSVATHLTSHGWTKTQYWKEHRHVSCAPLRSRPDLSSSRPFVQAAR
jgi:hypothetical protein